MELNAAVDTTVSVSQNWTRGGSPLSVDSRVMSFPLIMTSERVYQSSITFSPLSNQESIGDSGIYSCSATLETTMYVVGIQFIKTQTITVQGIFNCQYHGTKCFNCVYYAQVINSLSESLNDLCTFHH